MRRMEALIWGRGGWRRSMSGGGGGGLRLVQYLVRGGGPESQAVLGAELCEGGDIVELSRVNPSIPHTLLEFIRKGPPLIDTAKREVAERKCVLARDQVDLLAPVTAPDKILCVGLNYKSHCDEQNKPYPEKPFFFNKFPSTLVSPYGTVKHPPITRALDWEVELAVVIGKECRGVSKEEAMDYVFGVTVSQDISARDWQKPTRNNGQWLFAKSMDNFCPLGPCVLHCPQLDVQNLSLSCKVNGVLKQNGNTNDMVHSVCDMLAFLSNCITLLPGDIILTGTPSGVGVFRNPREFLKVGDEIETTISNIGTIKNRVV